MTTLTDRERELVEAAKTFFGAFGAEGGVLSDRLVKALRAYDPPKARKYTIPAWSELDDERRQAFKRHLSPVWRGCEDEMYMCIRECLALSTEEE